MKKFAFLIHLRTSYREDFALFSKALRFIPEPLYRLWLRNRPLKPFVWSEMRIRPWATEAEGYIIMVPLLGRQLLEQQRAALPYIEQAVSLAASKGAEIVGLGALTSPITLGGRLLLDNPHATITNGNAYTAVIIHEQIQALLSERAISAPKIAMVGATGSVGTLVNALIAKHLPQAELLLVARQERKLQQLRNALLELHTDVRVGTSTDIGAVRHSDIVVLLTSATDCLLPPQHLKRGAVVIDGTQPRNAQPSLLEMRPDITLIDGGLVSVPSLRFTRSIDLPAGLSFACLAETMLLALAGRSGHFSIGYPTLEHAAYVAALAQRFRHLGFGLAPAHCFGRPLPKRAALADPALCTVPSSL